MGRIVRSTVLRVVRALLALTLIVGAALALVCVLVMMQAQRDETRQADAIVVIVSPSAPQTGIAHAAGLYRQRFATRILLAADDTTAARSTLLNLGVPDDDIIVAEESEDAAESYVVQMRQVAELAYRTRVQRVLLVTEPYYALRDVKMAQDFGLDAYGVPLPMDEQQRLQNVWQGATGYWRYVLLGSE